MTATICLNGHIIRPQTRPEEKPSWQLIGNCENCNAGPLHGAQNGCRCSVLRNKVRLCRRCAIALDINTKGYSPLLSNAENASVRLAQSLSSPGVPEMEASHVYRFEVHVNAFGRPTIARRSVTKVVMQVLNNAFGDAVAVLDASGTTIPYDPKQHAIGGGGDSLYASSNGNGTHA